jgi:hypothetical protein
LAIEFWMIKPLEALKKEVIRDRGKQAELFRKF